MTGLWEMTLTNPSSMCSASAGAPEGAARVAHHLLFEVYEPRLWRERIARGYLLIASVAKCQLRFFDEPGVDLRFPKTNLLTTVVAESNTNAADSVVGEPSHSRPRP